MDLRAQPEDSTDKNFQVTDDWLSCHLTECPREETLKNPKKKVKGTSPLGCDLAPCVWVDWAWEMRLGWSPPLISYRPLLYPVSS